MKMGIVRVEGYEGAITTRYFAYRGKDEFKEQVAREIKEFFEYDKADEEERKEIELFITEDVYPAIDRAWEGKEFVYPQMEDYTVVFQSHDIDDSVMEEIVWNEIFSVWGRLQQVKVPENKRDEVAEALEEVGCITPSDGSEYAIRIYPEVDEDGWIVLTDENGERVDIRDIYEHDLIYDPFGLLRWLRDIEEAVSSSLSSSDMVSPVADSVGVSRAEREGDRKTAGGEYNGI